MLKRPHSVVLDECRGTLLDCLQLSRDLLDFLVESEVLSDELHRKVVCRANRRDRVAQLIDFLKNLGPKSYVFLVIALNRTQQPFLANILNNNIVR